jgi:glutathione S-transferase
MKLFYSPSACSLVPHIILEELEIPYSTIEVDLKNYKLKDSGVDYFSINKKEYVPALELADGALLTLSAEGLL